jgi:hypothetical protein
MTLDSFDCQIDMHFNIPDDVQLPLSPNDDRLQFHQPEHSRTDESNTIHQILQGGHLAADSEGDKMTNLKFPLLNIMVSQLPVGDT